MAADSSSPSSSSALSSPTSTSSTTSTLTTHNTNNANHTLTPSTHDGVVGGDTAGQNGDVEVRSRSISAPASRSSSFSENLDRLAFISQSAHTFPANLTPFSSSSRESSSSTSSHSATAVRSARSTPNSPRLGPVTTHHHERRAISRPASPSFSRRASGTTSPVHVASNDIRVRRRRARSWVNAPGAGFTPAVSTPISRPGHPPEGASTIHSNRLPRSSSQRHASSPETNFDALQAHSDLYARARCSSSSDSIGDSSSHGEERPARNRQYSYSARVSPVFSPLQPMTPVEVVVPTPHRTHSVPHMARISPMIYGYSYHYGPPAQDGQEMSQPGQLDGYFAIPHTNGMLSSNNISPLGGEEMPPPYTASQVDLHSMSSNYQNDAQASHIHERRTAEDSNDDEGEEEEGEDAAVLSFSTNRRQAADQQGNGESELRQRRRQAGEEVEEEEEEARESTDHVEMPSLPKQEREEDPTLHFSRVRLFVLLYILHPLRLIAALPGCIGTFWLLRNALLLLWREGTVFQRGEERKPSALEFALASLWSLATAYHALSFTTLLLRRWLHYYSILPSFIRLIALQAICWPLVRMTLYILGPRNPLASWVIISTTTAFSDTVARWVVSNITDEIHTPPEVISCNSNSIIPRNRNHINNRKRRRKTGMAFWRAVMGGPPAGAEAENHTSSSRQHPFQHHRSFITTTTATESEAESDVDFYRIRFQNRRNNLGASTRTQSDLTSGGEEEDPMMITPTNGLRINGIPTPSSHQRVGRFFHWDVAIRRNVLPIALLAYLSLGAMLIEQSVQRA